jgi:hypothetical protein
MDIGKEGEPMRIEPLVEPVPGAEPAPAPPDPVRKETDPVREPAKVPA